MYMPPVTAQFLSDISLTVHHGDVHGIVGATGCGKSTLLRAIAGRLDGSVSGQVLLNGQKLTGLNCNKEAITQRTSELMQQFDLMPHSQRRIASLSNSAEQRLILVLHLVRDPVLILMDDPLKDMDALSNYQLMSALREHCRRHSRMSIVTMRYPRSDIYQLLSQITMLFYGEIIFSGPTKFMPHYFSQIGYRCPVTENPAVYYLSLATVDRETPESYSETQSKAANLVDIFKKRRPHLDFSAYHGNLPADAPILSCYFGIPSVLRRFWILFGRCLLVFIRCPVCVGMQFLLLGSFLFLAAFGCRFYSTGRQSPHSVSGTIAVLSVFSSFSSIFSTAFLFRNLRRILNWEVSENLYNGSVHLMAFLCSSSIIDVPSILFSSVAFICASNLMALLLGVWVTHFVYKLITLSLFAIIPDSHSAALCAIGISLLSSVLTGGFLKSYQSFSSANEVLLYATALSPERFGNLLLFHEFVNRTRIPSCHRNELQPFNSPTEFCRWRSGVEYLAETVMDSGPPELWQGPFVVAITFIGTLVLFFLINGKRTPLSAFQ